MAASKTRTDNPDSPSDTLETPTAAVSRDNGDSLLRGDISGLLLVGFAVAIGEPKAYSYPARDGMPAKEGFKRVSEITDKKVSYIFTEDESSPNDFAPIEFGSRVLVSGITYTATNKGKVAVQGTIVVGAKAFA
jgi:hypothetical protein